MLNTTLCHIEKDGKYLMMHRVKKKNDINQDKWVGVGGKFEEGETPDECLLREVWEETGLTLTEYRLRGIVTFLSDKWEGEYMYLYTATGFEKRDEDGKLIYQCSAEEDDSKTSGQTSEFDVENIPCNEGNLEWIPKEDVVKLPIWEGDKLFFEELNADRGFFTMKLRYEGETLVESEVRLH